MEKPSLDTIFPSLSHVTNLPPLHFQSIFCFFFIWFMTTIRDFQNILRTLRKLTFLAADGGSKHTLIYI